MALGSTRSPRSSGPAYLRNAFTKGTDQEVGFLVDELGLAAGDARARRRVRAGPTRARAGPAWDRRHRRRPLARLRRARAPGRRGRGPPGVGSRCSTCGTSTLERAFDAVAVPLPGRLRAPRGRRRRRHRRPARGRAPARRPPRAHRFLVVLRAAVPRGRRGVRRPDRRAPRAATVRDEAGTEREFDLWTTCFTARELGLLLDGGRARRSTASPSVSPGDYGHRAGSRPARAPRPRPSAPGVGPRRSLRRMLRRGLADRAFRSTSGAVACPSAPEPGASFARPMLASWKSVPRGVLLSDQELKEPALVCRGLRPRRRAGGNARSRCG